MPLELGVWRIDETLTPVSAQGMDREERLEDILDRDISIASPNWLVIGRQVPTVYGKYIDLLAMDRDGRLIVIELKKDRTPRDVVAQLLDYGSWVKDLEDDDIADIHETYLKKYKPGQADQSMDDAFRRRFNVRELPEMLNTAHELIVVTSALDDSTERIVTYLAEEYSVPVNTIFFRVFKDGDREYITRAWLKDPTAMDTSPARRSGGEPWNGEFYVSFGHDRIQHWEDAVKYGFISAKGGPWHTKTLTQLEPGSRIWVNIPGTGYVGVGLVAEPVVRADDFTVMTDDGQHVPITQAPVSATDMVPEGLPDEQAMFLVRVNWLKTVPIDRAVKEKGFFGNQNTVAKPTAKSWVHTVDRLARVFGINMTDN